MRIERINLAISVFLVCFLPDFVAYGAVIRTVPVQVKESFCKKDFSRESLWNNLVFDIQVEGVFLEIDGKDGQLSLEILEPKAQALSKKFDYGGIAFDKCTEKTGWIAAFPSNEPLIASSNLLYFKNLPKCDGQLVSRFANDDLSSLENMIVNRQKDRSDLSLTPPDGKSGYFSIECRQKNNFARDMFLGPFGSPKSNEDKFQLISGSTNSIQLEKWINGKRAIKGLGAIRLLFEEELEKNKNKNLDAIRYLVKNAVLLAKRNDVHHDRKALQFARRSLRAESIELIGENRVIARDIEEAVGLLWMSPGHRELLLNPKVTLFGLGVSKSESGIIISMLAGVEKI